jgi:hypothetical protein
LQEVLGERVKAFLTWQNALNSLQKRREQRSRMELGGKLDRMGAVLEVCLQNTACSAYPVVEFFKKHCAYRLRLTWD